MFPPETHPQVTREAVRLAEKLLDSQLALIGALAQRAGALAGVFGAGATAMLGAEVLVMNALHEPLTLRVYAIALIAPAIMFVACTFCGMAAGTSSFQPAGNLPAAWKGNVTEDDLNEALKGELDNYQKYLDDNDKTISTHAKYFRCGLSIGFCSPITLALIGAVYFYGRC
jgi:hypothetical protein